MRNLLEHREYFLILLQTLSPQQIYHLNILKMLLDLFSNLIKTRFHINSCHIILYQASSLYYAKFI